MNLEWRRAIRTRAVSSGNVRWQGRLAAAARIERPTFEVGAAHLKSADLRDGLEIRYWSAPKFEVIRCDGGCGGLAPERFFGMSHDAERLKPPGRSVLDAHSQGNLSERPVSAKRAISRQAGTTVPHSMDDAKNFARCLLRTVRRIEENH